MTFLNPQLLWGLLLAFPLVAVYLLKVKPRKQPTNAWFLWEQVLDEKNTSSLFQKLRSFLSLLMMLLVLLFVCLGLSEIRFSEKDDRDVFIVIDQSASMQARVGDGTSVFDKAKEEAHSIVQSLSSGQRASIIVLNDSLEYLSHLSSNAHGLHDTIDNVTSSNIPDSLVAGRELASMSSAILNEEEMRIVFVTDGCHQFDSELMKGVEQVVVGDDLEVNNIGIVAADIQPNIASTTATAMVHLMNASGKEQEVEVEIFHKDSESIVELVSVKLKPGMNDPLFFDLPNNEEGVWRVKLITDDALAIDNEAEMILRSLPSLSVSIPSEDNYFYQRCVEAFSKTSGTLLLAEEGGEMNIFHGSVPQDFKGNALVFAPSGESSLWNDIGDPVIVDIPILEEKGHALVKHINVAEYLFPGARKLNEPEGSRVIVRSDAGVPLLYVITDADRSVVVANIDPQLDDFFLYTGFVTLIYDSALFLTKNDLRLPSVYPIGLRHEASEKNNYTSPDDVEIEVTQGQTFSPVKLGLYHAEVNTENASFTTALFSKNESSLKSITKSDERIDVSSGYPFSFWLIVLGVIILILESIFYHRRKAD